MRLPLGYICLPLRTATLPPAQGTNCYILGCEDALVVDPGTPYPKERRRLLEVLWRLRGRAGTVAAVLLTHHHPDHVAGAAYIARELGVPVAASAQTLHALALPEDVAVFAVDDGDTLKVDGVRPLKAIVTPGHAPGHLCLFEQRSGILIAGDMISGEGSILIAKPDGDMALYIKSLQQLAELAPDWVLPAHGPALRNGQTALIEACQHRLWREDRVWQAVQHGAHAKPAFDIARQAYREASPLVMWLALRSTVAHLHKLAEDHRVSHVQGDLWAPIVRATP